jgi:hypothetical protein
MAEEMTARGASPHHLMFGAGANTTVIHHNPSAKRLSPEI